MMIAPVPPVRPFGGELLGFLFHILGGREGLDGGERWDFRRGGGRGNFGVCRIRYLAQSNSERAHLRSARRFLGRLEVVGSTRRDGDLATAVWSEGPAAVEPISCTGG